MQPKFKLIVCEEKESYPKNNKEVIENKHDKLFKDLFNDKEEVKKFLKYYIRFDIENREIERCNNSYVSSKYKSYEADIVYKVKNENIFFLIEHQSTIDERMPYRILNYCFEIFKEEIDINKARNKQYQYPLIIPMVLYTGEKKWQVERSFSAKIKYSNNEEKYIEMKYELIDINNYEDDELLKNNTAISYAMLIEKSKGKETLIKTLNKISEVSNNNEVNKKLVKIIKYILSPILKEDTEHVEKKFKLEEELTMKTLQDYFLEEWTKLKEEKLEEGRQKGVKEGRKEGRKEGVKEGKQQGIKEAMKIIVLNMVKNKVEVEKIKEYTGIEEEEIQKIVANM